MDSDERLDEVSVKIEPEDLSPSNEHNQKEKHECYRLTEKKFFVKLQPTAIEE